MTAEGAPEFKGSQKELLVLPQTYLFCVLSFVVGSPHHKCSSHCLKHYLPS